MQFFTDGTEKLTHAYRLYTRGLNRNEIERLLKHDSSEVYAYYTRDMQPFTRDDLLKPRMLLRFIKELFLSFILKLSPARRFFYSIGLVLFLAGLVNSALNYEILGFLIINLLLALELADKLRTKNELEFAREIQLSLLPQNPPAENNVHLVAFTETATEVGGDYYDWFQLADGRVIFIIGDVSGKGITAALYMVKLQGFMQMLVREYQSPREILGQLNRLCKAQFKRNFFVTVAVAMYSPETKKMIICRAGHNPILHFDAANQQCHRLEPAGIALGLENRGIFEKTLAEQEIDWHPDDILFLYTDGLNETHNSQAEPFGENQIETLVTRYAKHTPEELKSIFVNRVLQFRGSSPIHDDLTFLIIKANP
jgi:serine phosphatase RsbU (regulator of sigma subunit)